MFNPMECTMLKIKPRGIFILWCYICLFNWTTQEYARDRDNITICLNICGSETSDHERLSRT